MLLVRLVQGLPHVAGLNPKAFRQDTDVLISILPSFPPHPSLPPSLSYRMFKTRHQYLYNAQRNILDGELLWKYTQLSSKEKTDFAKQIGTTQAQILEDLKEVDKVTSHF